MTYRERFIAMVKRFRGDHYESNCKPLSEIAPELLDMEFVVLRVDVINNCQSYRQARQRPSEVKLTIGDTTITLLEVVRC